MLTPITIKTLISPKTSAEEPAVVHVMEPAQILTTTIISIGEPPVTLTAPAPATSPRALKATAIPSPLQAASATPATVPPFRL